MTTILMGVALGGCSVGKFDALSAAKSGDDVTGSIAPAQQAAAPSDKPTAADLAFARSVYDALHPVDPDFRMGDVLDLVESHQDIARFAA